MDCGAAMPYQDYRLTCVSCGSNWLEAEYNYQYARVAWRAELAVRPFDAWRYHELLPVRHVQRMPSGKVGGTPLVHARRLGEQLGLDELYIKDERLQTTGSFKDRQAAVTVAHLVERGINNCVLASTGNAALAYAAACARAGIRLWVFLTSLAPAAKMRELTLYGAEVIKITGTYDQAKQIAAEFASRRQFYYERGVRSYISRAGMKTLAYETVEQLGWQAPDWYIQAVSGGVGPLGVYRGFVELQRMGLIDRLPALGLIQVEGCAPMVEAFLSGAESAVPVSEPHTHIAILSTGNPGQAYTHLLHAVRENGGAFARVSDAQAFQAMRRLAQVEGIACEPAAAVAFAGLAQLVERGMLRHGQRVVVNCSGHTLPAERFVVPEPLGATLDLTAPPEPSIASAGYEGLSAALEHLDQQVRTVVIIEDNQNDALLMRRLLESSRPYRVFVAGDGREGLELVRARLPDLVILDLMLPAIDGFEVLEALKNEPRTRPIPVFVMSAKELTPDDRRRLRGRIEALWQKSSLGRGSFVARIIERIEQN
jgi:threonine synthase